MKRNINPTLLACFKKGDEPDLGRALKGIYKTLSQEIHAPTIKVGSGMYEVPLLPNLSESETCILEKLVTEGLGWNKVKFVRFIDEDEGRVL